MKSTFCLLNVELAEVKNMLADKQTLVSLDAQLSRLNSINKQPPSLAANIFYATVQAVMPKVSPEEISIGGGFCRNLLSFDSQFNRIDPSTDIIFLSNAERGYITKFKILIEGVFQYSIK